MADITVRKNLPIPANAEWQFLGGLIDPLDLEEGPLELNVSLEGRCSVFALNKERVGFPGAIGIKTGNRSVRHPISLKEIWANTITLFLWPRMPAKDTPAGYIDHFDPENILELQWCFEEKDVDGKKIASIFWMEAEFEHRRLHYPTAGYAIQLLAKARELWPVPDVS